MTTTTMAYTKDEILKKLITRASDSLVLDVYARIQQDRRPWGDQWIRPGAVKSWSELVNEAMREGALTIEEADVLACGDAPLTATRSSRRGRPRSPE